MFNSLRNRILLAFCLVVLLMVGVSTLVSVWSARRQLEIFVGSISAERESHERSEASHEGREGTEFHDESNEFIEGTFLNTLLGGIITAFFALMIGTWLANRINAPVTALTRAATRLAESGDAEHIEVRSDDELGQMSKAFNQMTDALSSQKEVRRQLISDISHELNTPLSIIRLEAKGIVDGMQSPEEAAGNIQREVDLLGGLIADLELIAEVDQQAFQLKKESVNLAEFLEEITGRWRSEANVRNIKLQLALSSLPPAVTFDPDRMRQVLDNLLRNALQYTDQDGRISVTVSADSEHLTIAVRDSGCGIAAEHLPRLFDRFYRVDEARQRNSGGRGLGLAIVKQLVALHGGQVRVKSEPGEGSTFSVSLPLSA